MIFLVSLTIQSSPLILTRIWFIDHTRFAFSDVRGYILGRSSGPWRKISLFKHFHEASAWLSEVPTLSRILSWEVNARVPACSFCFWHSPSLSLRLKNRQVVILILPSQSNLHLPFVIGWGHIPCICRYDAGHDNIRLHIWRENRQAMESKGREETKLIRKTSTREKKWIINNDTFTITMAAIITIRACTRDDAMGVVTAYPCRCSSKTHDDRSEEEAPPPSPPEVIPLEMPSAATSRA